MATMTNAIQKKIGKQLPRFLAVLLLWGMYLGRPAYAFDACEKIVPQSLRGDLTEKLPDYRIANVSDQKTDGVKSDKYGRKAGPCPTVVSGDFDGDRDKDFALFLVDKKTAASMLVSAFATQKGWAIVKLPIWNEQISGAYVVLAKSGTYASGSANGALRASADAKESLVVGSQGVVARSGIVAGHANATRAAYAYEDGHWMYVLDPK